MKIAQMLEREDFYKILRSTLERYFEQFRGVAVKIELCSSIFKGQLLVYPHINAIVTRLPSREVRKYILTQFSVRGNFVKRIAAKLYVFACLHSFGLLASKSVTLSDKSCVKSSILLWPCNRKIRIFRFDDGLVDSILKTGITNRYMRTETEFRAKNNNFTFIPAITGRGNDWYIEKIMEGSPLARITRQNEYDNYEAVALRLLQELAEKSLTLLPAADYAASLKKSVDAVTDLLKGKLNESILTQTISIAESYLTILKNNGDQIPLALSHGDFQAGNIWVDSEGKVTLIDWETVGVRSVWYDRALLTLNMRRPDRIARLPEIDDEALFTVTGGFKAKKWTVLSVILLEELLFFLDETATFPKTFSSSVLEALLVNLETVLLKYHEKAEMPL